MERLNSQRSKYRSAASLGSIPIMSSDKGMRIKVVGCEAEAWDWILFLAMTLQLLKTCSKSRTVRRLLHALNSVQTGIFHSFDTIR